MPCGMRNCAPCPDPLDCRARYRSRRPMPNAPAIEIKDHIRPISGFPEAGHPVLRHLDPAGACRGLAGDGRAPGRGAAAAPARPAGRHRIARLPGGGAAGLRARLRLRHGAQEGQAAGPDHPAHLRSRIRHRHDRDPGRRRSTRASAWSCVDDLLATGGTHVGGDRAAAQASAATSRPPPASSSSPSSTAAASSTCRSPPSCPTISDADGPRRLLRDC